MGLKKLRQSAKDLRDCEVEKKRLAAIQQSVLSDRPASLIVNELQLEAARRKKSTCVSRQQGVFESDRARHERIIQNLEQEKQVLEAQHENTVRHFRSLLSENKKNLVIMRETFETNREEIKRELHHYRTVIGTSKSRLLREFNDYSGAQSSLFDRVSTFCEMMDHEVLDKFTSKGTGRQFDRIMQECMEYEDAMLNVESFLIKTQNAQEVTPDLVKQAEDIEDSLETFFFPRKIPMPLEFAKACIDWHKEGRQRSIEQMPAWIDGLDDLEKLH